MVNEGTKGRNIGTIIVLLLTIIGVIATVKHVNYRSTRSICMGIVYLLMYGFVAFYGIIGYKKPHGNMLRWIILAFSFSLFVNCQAFLVIVKTLSDGIKESFEYDGLDLFRKSISELLVYSSAVLAGYMAGRLHRIKSNAVITVIVLVCLIARMVLANYFRELYANNVLLWLAICSAYMLRYQLHKEAGIEVTVKN